jgi:hypothetical protein
MVNFCDFSGSDYIATYDGFAWLIIMGSGFDDWIYWQFCLQLQSVITAHNQWLSTTRSISTNVFSSTETNDKWMNRLNSRMNSFLKLRKNRVETTTSISCDSPVVRGNVSLLIFVASETCVNPWQRFDIHQRIRCHGNLCLGTCYLATEVPLLTT